MHNCCWCCLNVWAGASAKQFAVRVFRRGLILIIYVACATESASQLVYLAITDCRVTASVWPDDVNGPAKIQMDVCLTRRMLYMHVTHVAIYVLVRYSMKNAARCDTHCELYDSANRLTYQHIMYCRIMSGRVSVSVANMWINIKRLWCQCVAHNAECHIWHVSNVRLLFIRSCWYIRLSCVGCTTCCVLLY